MRCPSNSETWRPPAREIDGPRVLVVDDDPIQRRLCRLHLLGAGFRVDMAAGVDEALRRAEAQVPNVILSDVLMGADDGFDLCRRIRADHALASVPVVLASAHFREDADRALAQRLGANALVTRTADFNAELAAVRTALATGAPARDGLSDAEAEREHQRRTSHQLSALALRATATERRYRMLLENARESITLVDPLGVIVDANRHCERLLGAEPGGLIGHHIAEYAAPGHERSNMDAYLESMKDEPGAVPPLPVIGADGSTLFMEWANTPVEIDGRQLVFCIGSDVTTSVRAAEDLRRSEEKYRSLLERIPSVVWSCDAEGGVDYVSGKFADVTGFTAEERHADVGIWINRVHVDDRDRVRAAFSEFIHGGEPYDVEYRWQHRDGRWLWIHDQSSGRYIRNGRVRADGLFCDVTKQHELEDNLRQAQKLEAIGQLAGGVAHDFNNLLSVIMGSAGFLEEELAKGDPRREDVDAILEAARRAAGLTRQLLAFSRKDVVRPVTFAVDSAVDESCKMLRRLIGEDVSLSLDLGAVGACIEIDHGQFEQVLLNLAVNGRDAMPDGGKLSITTASVELAAGDQLGLAAGRYVSLAVRDAGTGIAPALLPRIFEPFFTTKEPGKGTGLGLSTVYGIVHSAGGAIDVESAPGCGTVFTVLLPRKRTAASTDAADERATTRGTETILVVEDEAIVRNITCRILAGAGYHVLEARDAATATAMLEDVTLHVDLVMSDVVMPATSGPSMIAQLRVARPALKVLYASGYSTHNALSAQSLEGADHFLQKPFASHTLLTRIRELLS